MAYLPHKNIQSIQWIKSKFQNIPKDIKDFNNIFFGRQRPFFQYVSKEEANHFLKYYKYLQKLVLQIEQIFPENELSLLKTKQKFTKHVLNRKQVALIFLLSFFNCIKLNNNNCNIFMVSNVLFCSSYHQFEFARCFLNYLTQIGKWLSEGNSILEEKITYVRDNIDIMDYQDQKLCDIKIYEEGSLFDGNTSYCVDFANKYIGGGVLNNGCVQEEILFAISPEAVVSLFFMEVMDDNDAIGIYNIIQYSNYKGYGDKFKFIESAIPRDISKIKKHNIIAIDAISYKKSNKNNNIQNPNNNNTYNYNNNNNKPIHNVDNNIMYNNVNNNSSNNSNNTFNNIYNNNSNNYNTMMNKPINNNNNDMMMKNPMMNNNFNNNNTNMMNNNNFNINNINMMNNNLNNNIYNMMNKNNFNINNTNMMNNFNNNNNNMMNNNLNNNTNNMMNNNNFNIYNNNFNNLTNNNSINNRNNNNNFNNNSNYSINNGNILNNNFNNNMNNVINMAIKRDIHKAYVGFHLINYENQNEKTISTGNWGCGAFEGNHELKFIQQWIAASFAGVKRLDYFTFKNKKMINAQLYYKEIGKKFKTAYQLYYALLSNQIDNNNIISSLLNIRQNNG